MISKKSLIVALLVVAVLLSVFSLVMSVSSDSNSKQDNQVLDLGGNVNLEVLPSENNVVVSGSDK